MDGGVQPDGVDRRPLLHGTREDSPLMQRARSVPGRAGLLRPVGGQKASAFASSSGRSSSSGPASAAQRGTLQAVQKGTPLARQKDKFVPLPGGEPGQGGQQAAPPTAAALHPSGAPGSLEPGGVLALPPLEPGEGGRDSLFSDIEAQDDQRYLKGLISVRCVAEAFDRKALERTIHSRFPKYRVHLFPEVVHAQSSHLDPYNYFRDIFFFDYGVMVSWGLGPEAEKEILNSVAGVAMTDPLPETDVEKDEYQYQYSSVLPPHMQNDIITINKKFARDHQVKLAISHALAQSTKLRVYEQRIMEVVAATKDLPEALAKEGVVRLSRRRVAKLIGEVFLQRTAVHLLSSIMDTPEFFWSAPDHLQALYKRVCEYLETETRGEVLDTRFQVLQEMLDMLREHQNYLHMVRLEWIVIWLVLAEVLVGLVEILGLIGWLGRAGRG